MILAALAVLKKHLNRRQQFAVLTTFSRQNKKKLWAGFAPASDRKEAGSRDQLGDAMRLHAAMLAHIPADQASLVTREVVKAGAIAFLRGTLPVLDQEEVASRNPEELRKLLAGLVDPFPNSDGEIIVVNPSTMMYRVTRCRFPEILARLGHPELASAFCSGDLEYFKDFQPSIEASRDTTIAGGNTCCEFIFRLKNQARSGTQL